MKQRKKYKQALLLACDIINDRFDDCPISYKVWECDPFSIKHCIDCLKNYFLKEAEKEIEEKEKEKAMKISKTVTYKHEYEVPEGDYCQREDGSVSCKQYCYEIDPIFGTAFYCNDFGLLLLFFIGLGALFFIIGITVLIMTVCGLMRE